MKRLKKSLLIVLGILLLLVAINFALEPVALHYANKALGDLKGYKGSIKDVDIHLYRGAYRIDTLVIDKMEKGKSQPFFKAAGIDISIEWKSLFKGAIVGEFSVEQPVLNFIKRGKEVDAGGNNDFIETVKKLSPVNINFVEILDGQVHYIDLTSSPKIDIAATQVAATARNLRNIEDKSNKLPSSLELTASTSGNGKIKSNAKLNALKEIPDFDFNLELERMDLTYLKDFTDAYADFTFKRGQLYVSTELAMDDGNYNGYVKPVMENIKIIDLTPDTPKEKKRPFFKRLWEIVVGTGAEIVTNQPKDRLATKIPLKGNVNGGEKFTWTAIVNVLRNGFIKAFDKDVEGSIDFNDAKSGKTEKK
ncbi:uncharacterized protein DUF748 [Flavobacterium sp. 270]|uniref:DUF748 domain-containing protein n=1 Tax=Flavobacterium sp. 270 TaxID=2512114 RepID=UPI001065218E|nr:DUF748 domain-containing protein [Flavobacterium sp. 270]TDW46655.1 uncharacterized protein DUF748 [Flavobacterium sp. 270]